MHLYILAERRFMFLRFLFTRSELRGTLILSAGAIAIRLLLFAIRPAGIPEEAISGPESGVAANQAIAGKTSGIEINSADSIHLLDLDGIGPVFASRIIKYRKSLGGFRRIGQLLEVYGMDSVRFNGLKGQVRIDTLKLRKLDVNRATFKELLAHPYLEYEQVKAVCRFRERKGRLQSPAEIWAAGILPDSIHDKLIPYLFAGKDSVEKVKRSFVK